MCRLGACIKPRKSFNPIVHFPCTYRSFVYTRGVHPRSGWRSSIFHPSRFLPFTHGQVLHTLLPEANLFLDRSASSPSAAYFFYFSSQSIDYHLHEATSLPVVDDNNARMRLTSWGVFARLMFPDLSLALAPVSRRHACVLVYAVSTAVCLSVENSGGATGCVRASVKYVPRRCWKKSCIKSWQLPIRLEEGERWK